MASARPPAATATGSVLMNRLLARGKFRHLQVLLRLVELGSVQRTAEAVGTSQSAVTQTLAYLEDLLEVRLFERHARGVRPTRACLALLPVVRQLMNGLAQGAEAIAALNQRGRGLIRLTASPSATSSLVVRVLTAFHDRHPDIEVALREADGEGLLLSATNHEADLVACRRTPVIPEGWTFHPLLRDELVVIAARDHPLARKRKVDWAQLARQSWVLPPVGSVARVQFDALLPRLPDEARVYPLVTRTVTAMWWVMRERAALAFVPRSSVHHLVDIGELAVLRLPEQRPLEPMGVLAPAGEVAGSAALLLHHLRAEFAAGAPG